MAIPHAILTSLGSLTSLMRPCKGVLRPATTGFRRAVSPRKDTAEQRPSTPFPREEMAWTAMAAIHIVAHILRTNVNHLNPARRLAEPFSTAMLRSNLESYPPAALLLMNPSAHPYKIAQGVLPAESSTHKCQSAGAIPTHRPQTPLIRDPNRATFYVFYLLPDTFLGTTFRAWIWPVLESGICSEMT